MQEKKLEMYGGLFGGLIPLIVLVGGLVWLSVAERGGTKPFWACAWIALCVGIFFAKNKEEYCKAAMRGIGDRTGIVIVTAWLLAGVFGKLMAAGGLVQGLLWMGMTTGAQGGVFVVLVFLAAMLFALGTGTSTGTCIALSPVLYPAGYFLGADPAMLGWRSCPARLSGTTSRPSPTPPSSRPTHRGPKCATWCAAVSRWPFQRRPFPPWCSLCSAEAAKCGPFPKCRPA